MKPATMALFGVIAMFGLGISGALGEDQEAGVPLRPAEAAGGWTVESGGHALCMIRLTADHRARPGANCGDALPPGVAGWAPTSNGMALTNGGGQVLEPFDRWSNSLFVAYHGVTHDVQLMRGPPNVGS